MVQLNEKTLPQKLVETRQVKWGYGTIIILDVVNIMDFFGYGRYFLPIHMSILVIIKAFFKVNFLLLYLYRKCLLNKKK